MRALYRYSAGSINYPPLPLAEQVTFLQHPARLRV